MKFTSPTHCWRWWQFFAVKNFLIRKLLRWLSVNREWKSERILQANVVGGEFGSTFLRDLEQLTIQFMLLLLLEISINISILMPFNVHWWISKWVERYLNTCHVYHRRSESFPQGRCLDMIWFSWHDLNSK